MNNSREYPSRPICGVGAVVRKGENVLLIRRGKAPRKGEWSIPGGAVELGETWREAAIREVHEECGIEIELDEMTAPVDIILRDPEGRIQYHYALVDWAARWLRGDLQASSDAMEARWVGKSELDNYPMNPLTRAVIDQVMV